MKSRIALALAAALIVGCAAPALAWGPKGHAMVNRVAAAHLAGRMPAFVTSADAQFEIAYLGPELDRMKGSGPSWDSDRDPGHYVDLQDDGTIAGVPVAHLPRDREAYDTALRDAGTDQYKQGYLPYALLDGWEQLRDDFAYWRVDDYALRHAKTAAERAERARVRALDQDIVLRDLGQWGHYVADAAQPLHVTVHFNGWGRYPNLNGYTESKKTHAFFESTFVDRYVSQARVNALVKPQSSLSAPNALLEQRQVMAAIVRYLEASNDTVPRLYQIEKTGGFAHGSPAAVQFAASRLAAGAMELRDLSVWAWQDSLYSTVGYPEESVRDILSGKSAWPPRD